MPHCIAPGCTSGYKSNPEKVHFFTVPKDQSIINLWQNALRRKDFVVRSGQFLCEHHFLPEDILWKRELTSSDGQVLGVSYYKQPRLRKGVVPSQFPWVENTSFTSLNDMPLQDASPLQETTNSMHEISEQQNPQETVSEPYKFSFIDLVACTTLQLPINWIRCTVSCEGIKIESFVTTKCFKIENSFVTINTKELIVQENLNFQINVMCKPFDATNLGTCSDTVNSIEKVESILRILDLKKICCGISVANNVIIYGSNVTCIDNIGTVRHKQCTILLDDEQQCISCKRYEKTLKRKALRMKKQQQTKRIQLTLSPRRQKEVLKLRQKCHVAFKAKRRAQKSTAKMKNNLKKSLQAMAKINSQSIDEILTNKKIPKHQCFVIKEILSVANSKNKHGRRYSEEWMLLCMLMHMRSPTSYNFIRNNEILPLPCVRTIRRHLSIINTTCGFDPKFFELLKLTFSQKDTLECHGVILFDEISTRESISVDSRNLTYKGLIDFGEDGFQSTDVTEKANHGLVLMFQALHAKYTQPIAVFASRGPVTGINLSLIIVKAITLLEKAGARIHGVICDGSSTNRRFWTEMGVNGKINNVKNYFEHPVERDRKIYVFSDTPHLIKTVRNRLYNNGTLQIDPAESPISWEYFNMLYTKDKDLQAEYRICPKISKNHLDLNSAAKMRVRLAVQIFSKSMARGLRYYKKYYPKEFENCESTAAFCEWLNDMFDALNRKQSQNGLIPNNNDFKVLKDALQRLDEWEGKVKQGILPESSFLTHQTAEGLRVTLQSTMDIVCYLIEKYQFSYVLTGRLNQDPLEVCHGFLFSDSNG